jgi:hypothetical protein
VPFVELVSSGWNSITSEHLAVDHLAPLP